MGALLGTLLIMEKQLGYLEKSRKTRPSRISSAKHENRFNFVKIIRRKTVISIWHCESGCFAMQNLRFYRAKQPLLERKTIGFAKR